MYGKIFQSTFTGSMFGKGLHVFATWAYALANKDKEGFVELNPDVLASVFGASADEIRCAITFLTAPDPNSRSPNNEGRRLEKIDQFAYHVVNSEQYNNIAHEEDRREYLRGKQKEHRTAQKSSPNTFAGKGVKDVNSSSQQVSTGVNKPSTVVSTSTVISKVPDEQGEFEGVGKSELPVELQTAAFWSVWVQWMKYRREICHALKPTTVKLQLTKLARCGEPAAIAMLRQSMENGWQGIFQVHDQQRSEPPDNPRLEVKFNPDDLPPGAA